MPQVFISYSRKDLAFVEHLASDLKEAGLDVWYDLSGLEGGARWRIEIEKAIRESQYVIVVLSPNSVASEWVEEERLFAQEIQKKIIPLLYKKCDLPLGYRTRHFIDIQGTNYEQNFNEILRALDVQPVVPKKIHPQRKWKPQNIMILVALFGLILVAVFGLPPLLSQVENTPEPTMVSTTEVKQEPIPTDTITVTAKPSSTSTEAFTPTATPLPAEITDAFGAEMVLVPAGEFTMGNEKTAHTVYLDAFYIDKYEVTNTLYKACEENAHVCDPPPITSSSTHSSYYEDSEFNNYPVIHVDWYMAKAYCEWRGGSLPSEAQWEKAARGTDERTYPWGEVLDCNKANYGGCIGDTTEVGSYEDGVNPYGLYDMAGNVLEWVSDWYDSTYYAFSSSSNPTGPVSGSYRVLRGGAWGSSYSFVRSASRYWDGPSYTSSDVGFRCSRSIPAGGSP